MSITRAVALLLLSLACVHAFTKVGNYLVPQEGGKVSTGNPRLPRKCDVAIVGGGPGGVYAGYRLVADAPETYKSVCLFELQDRLGGRITTLRGLGDKKDMVLDMGAYRYIGSGTTVHTLVAGVIESLLKLKWKRYDPASPTFRITTDETGDSTGFVHFVEDLAKLAIGKGMKVFFNMAVTKTDKTPSGTYKLSFRGSKRTVEADHVIFNVPQRPLYRILQASNIARFTTWNEALFTPFQMQAAKMYLYYPDAWWRYMNLVTGSINDPTPPPDAPGCVSGNQSTLFTTVPLRGRYHDADYHCDEGGKCWGFLLMTYNGDNSGTWNAFGQGFNIQPYNGVLSRYYSTFAVNEDAQKPYVVLDGSTQMGAELLKDAHFKVVEWHTQRNLTIPAVYANTLPTQAVVAVWDGTTRWAGGAWHSMKTGTRIPNTRIANESMYPYPGENIYVGNEFNSPVQGWAEGSLVVMENILTQVMKVPKPTFITAERHNCVLWPTYNFNRTFCNSEISPEQGTVRRAALESLKL